MEVDLEKLYEMKGRNFVESIAIHVVFTVELMEKLAGSALSEKLKPAVVSRANKTVKEIAEAHGVDMDELLIEVNKQYYESMETIRAALYQDIFGEEAKNTPRAEKPDTQEDNPTEDLQIDIAQMLKDQLDQ